VLASPIFASAGLLPSVARVEEGKGRVQGAPPSNAKIDLKIAIHQATGARDTALRVCIEVPSNQNGDPSDRETGRATGLDRAQRIAARVIKVERPGTGDVARAYDERVGGLASHFVWTNRSKESLTLDVKNLKAAAVLERLILEKADVVVQDLAPGAAARTDLTFASPGEA